MNAEVIIKVYDESGVYLGVLNDPANDFSYTNEINSVGTAIQITLGRNADSTSPVLETIQDDSGSDIIDGNSFDIMATVRPKNKVGPGSLINHNYKVVVTASTNAETAILDDAGDEILDNVDNEIIASVAGDGAVRFQGFISDIALNYGGAENVVITVSSYGYDLDQYLVESAGDTRVAFNSYDPSDIIKDGLDDFYALAGTINYDTGTVETTGTTVSYTFNTNTYKELIEKALELSPSDWFYYVDFSNNFLYFKERPATPTHYFYLGKHIESLDLSSTILSVVNDAVFSGGDTGAGENLMVRYTEAVASNTRRGLKRFSDNRVTLEASADIIAEGEVERYNKILYRTTIVILAAEYDINTIQIGDLIGFRNFDNYVDELELQVVRLKWELDKVTLELGTLLPKVSKRIEDIRRNMILEETRNNPDAPLP